MPKLALVTHHDKPVEGWFPTNLEGSPPFLTGATPLLRYVVGKQSGLDTHNCDVFCTLDPHSKLEVDLAESLADSFSLPPPAKCDAWLGGVPVRIGGVRMTRVSTAVNGAAYDIHYKARIGPMLLVHVFLHWYPDQAWCPGEIMLCASNQAFPDMIATIPANLRLQIGEALVSVPGLPFNPVLMQEGDWLAHGQVRALPFTLTWLEFATAMDKETAFAVSNSLIQVRGIENLMLGGNPFLPEGFDALAWTNGLLPTVIAKQHDWLDSPLDPAMDSRRPGAQGAQSFAAGPAMADPTAMAVIDIAARDGSWPMVHMEADGETLQWWMHPNLRIYTGQANTRICTDWLGKPRVVTSAEAHGYAGPEDEHWFDFILWPGARLKGRPAMQRLMEAHAVNFLFRWVTEPPGNWLSANRAMGWLGFVAGELFRGLADRALADAVAARFKAVVDQLIIPIMGPNDAWWSWTNAGSIGASDSDLRAMPWQAEVMAVGMWYAGTVCGHAPAVDFAYKMSEEIVKRAWFKRVDGYWVSRDVIAQNGADLPYYDAYRHFGMKACDVLLKRDPAHVAAGEIWRQRKKEAAKDLYMLSWFLPGVSTTT